MEGPKLMCLKKKSPRTTRKGLMRRTPNSSRGFSLLELTIAAAIGAVIIVTAADLFSRAMRISWITSQKAELQQDFRAASNLLQRDLSMAGAGALGQQGLSTSAVGLPAGTGTLPVYPCSGLVTCNYINGAPVAYPTTTGVPYIYSIIPGPNLGITVNAAQGPTDIITVISADVTLALNCYSSSINAAATTVTFQLPAGPPWPATCVLPQTVVAPQPLNAAVIGLQQGDLILWGNNAVGVVTGAVTPCAPTGTNTACYTVPFAATDPGHINQPSAVTGSLSQFVGAGAPASTAIPYSAVRLLAVTYYLAIPPATGLPTLMRLQSGKAPAPVAENVVYLKFSYDVYDAGVVDANQATLPVGTNPGMITKVNIAHMSMRSQQTKYQGIGYQGLDLQTSIAARNLTSQQEYPIQGSSY
jgi:prepilin-type N-terminal cleavage/methylation domain-containing protein